ncbi:FAD-binding protein [Arcanobacterium hippocoleae]
MSRILVIGSGLSGMASALMLREAGHTVTIISRGMGGMLLANGTLDLLGWHSNDASTPPVREIEPEFAKFVANHPFHPYAKIGLQNARAGISWLTKN